MKVEGDKFHFMDTTGIEVRAYIMWVVCPCHLADIHWALIKLPPELQNIIFSLKLNDILCYDC